jgi:hypothetical protein
MRKLTNQPMRTAAAAFAIGVTAHYGAAVYLDPVTPSVDPTPGGAVTSLSTTGDTGDRSQPVMDQITEQEYAVPRGEWHRVTIAKST